MKKGWILLTVLLALLLCACGVEEGYDPELMITRAPQSETQAQEMEIAVVEPRISRKLSCGRSSPSRQTARN